jgi:hypothetical protein
MVDPVAIVPDVIELGEDPEVLPDRQGLREGNVGRREVDLGEDRFTVTVQIQVQDPGAPGSRRRDARSI